MSGSYSEHVRLHFRGRGISQSPAYLLKSLKSGNCSDVHMFMHVCMDMLIHVFMYAYVILFILRYKTLRGVPGFEVRGMWKDYHGEDGGAVLPNTS